MDPRTNPRSCLEAFDFLGLPTEVQDIILTISLEEETPIIPFHGKGVTTESFYRLNNSGKRAIEVQKKKPFESLGVTTYRSNLPTIALLGVDRQLHERSGMSFLLLAMHSIAARSSISVMKLCLPNAVFCPNLSFFKILTVTKIT